MACALLSWPDVWQRRLAAHFLDEPAPTTRLTDVVGAVCGIPSQVAASAELSLGLRLDRIRQADVRAALWTERSLVKTYGLRGTLHIFPTREIPTWLAALRARVPPRPPNLVESEAIPPGRLDDVLEAVRDALDGHQLEEVEVDGWRALGAVGAPSPSGTGTVHLLPRFDCYVVGCHPRTQLIPTVAPAALQGGTAAPFQVLLVDGVVAGLWEQQRRAGQLSLRVDPFNPLSATHHDQLAHQAQRMADFYGVEPQLELGHVEPRGHM